ncbi:GATA transcription factor 23 [Cardamine amara subsp. amara]|uniref:GATA transcription factor 23 n=1 Tax=Cardamine amara subsp. amara TaxID=228776 RepID=A0ABD1BEU0_CARAN
MEEKKETVRCCSDCKTTKTPMWRGGPAGPKSLCNACGIRLRKQRRSELLGIRMVHSHKALGFKKINPKSSSHGSVSVKKLRILKEEEQAALCLLLLSCSSVFA